MLALFCRVRRYAGKSKSEMPVYEIDQAALDAYMAADDCRLTEGCGKTEVLDAMGLCLSVVNPRS